MKAGKGTNHRRAGIPAALLALLILLSALVPACAEGPEKPKADVDLMLAEAAVRDQTLTDPEGKPIAPHKAPDLEGRGMPAGGKDEPDYTGVVGYAALQTDWEVTRFSTFNRTPWRLPVYRPDGDKWATAGSITHKTPVLVISQKIAEGKGHKYYGYLQVVRLDTDEVVWLDVAQFVTVPYWTLELKEAIRYGYCIAVYKNNSRYEPTDRKKHRGALPEGIRVLVSDWTTARYRSWDKENNPILGIVFRNNRETESYFRTFLFFNPDDLLMIY